MNEILIKLGINFKNQVVKNDIVKNNLLLCGKTGMGKSNLLNNIIDELVSIYLNEVNLLLVDTKDVEFVNYRESIIDNVKVVNNKNFFEEVENIKLEIKRRKQLLNEKNTNKLKHIVIVIDELSDLLVEDQEKTKQALKFLVDNKKYGVIIICSTMHYHWKMFADNSEFIFSLFPTRCCFQTQTCKESEIILGNNGAWEITERGVFIYKDKSTNTKLKCDLNKKCVEI